MIFTTLFGLITPAFAVAGLGEGLVPPALGAFFLDISEERHRSQVMGIRGSAGALGGVVGPLLAATAARFMPPQSAFTGLVAVVIFGALLALFVLREPGRAAGEVAAGAWEVSGARLIAARASLQGVVLRATVVRRQEMSYGGRVADS
jgi:nitrate/nitrite transporter NarK